MRTLKTAVLDTASHYPKSLAFDAVTACRVADITELARKHPDLPVTDISPHEEIELLHTLLKPQGHHNVMM